MLRSAVLTAPFVLLAGCGSGSTAAETPVATASATPTPSSTPEPVVAAEHFLGCSDTSGRRFVVAGPLHNVGDVPLRLRTTIRWQLQGSDLVVRRTFRVDAGKRRRVRFLVPAEGNVLQRFDAAGGGCSTEVTILGREGTVTTAP